MKFKTVEQAKAYLLGQGNSEEMAEKLARDYLEEVKEPEKKTVEVPPNNDPFVAMTEAVKTMANTLERSAAQQKEVLEKIETHQVEILNERKGEKEVIERKSQFQDSLAKVLDRVPVDAKSQTSDLMHNIVKLHLLRGIYGMRKARDAGIIGGIAPVPYHELPQMKSLFGVDSKESLDKFVQPMIGKTLRPSVTGGGAEFIEERFADFFIDIVRVDTPVFSRINIFDPLSTPFTVPLAAADQTWRFLGRGSGTAGDQGGGSTAVNIDPSNRGTSSLQFTAGKIGAATEYDDDMLDDSIIPMLDFIQNGLQVSGAETLEETVIFGDVATGASTNINIIDGTPTVSAGGSSVYLWFDGIVKHAIDNDSSGTHLLAVSGALALSSFDDLRKKGGKYFLNFNKAFFYGNASIAIKTANLLMAQAATNILGGSLDPQTGGVQSVGGLPFLITAGLPDRTNSAGKVSATAANNSALSFGCVNPGEVWFARRKQMTMEIFRYPSQQNIMTVVMRGDQKYPHSGDAFTAYAYNVTL